MAARKKISPRAATRLSRSWPEKALWLSAGSVALGIVVSAVFGASMQPEGVIPAQLTLLLILCLPFAAALTGGVRIPRFSGDTMLLGALALLIPSALLTVSPGRTLLRLPDVLLASAVFLVGLCLTARERAQTLLLSGVAAAGFAAAAIGANEYVVHARAGDYGWRVFSTFFNPGFLAGFLAVTALVTLGLLLAAEAREWAVAAGFAALIQIVVITLTGTRAGILAFAGGLVLLGALCIAARVLTKQRIIRLGIVLLLALMLGLVVGRPAGQRMQSVGEEGHSFAFRVYTWKATAQMALARPLAGFGPGTFEVAFHRYPIAGYTRLAHSNYLQAAAEHGIPGAILLFGGWFWLFGRAAAKLRRLSPEHSAVVAAAIAAAAATAVRGVFDSDWWNLPILLSVAACASVAAACAEPTAAKWSAGASRVAGMGLAALATAALITGSLSLISTYAGTLAEAIESKAHDTHSRIDFAYARDLWESAGKRAPWDVRSRMRAAQLDALLSSEPRVPSRTVAEFERLKKLEPTNPKVPVGLAQLYLSFGQEQEGLREFREARRLDPKSPRLLLEMALAAERAGRQEEALDVWRWMIEVEESPYGQVRALPQIIDPSFAWAHASLGDYLAAKGKSDEAKERWRAAEKRLQQYLASIRELGPVMRAAGLLDPEQRKAAESLLEEVERRLPGAE